MDEKTIKDLQARVDKLEQKNLQFSTVQDGIPRFQRVASPAVLVVATNNITLEINGKAYQINVLPV